MRTKEPSKGQLISKGPFVIFNSPKEHTPPLWRDLVKISTTKLWHTSSFLLERTDFKNVIFEKIPWAPSEVAEVAEV